MRRRLTTPNQTSAVPSLLGTRIPMASLLQALAVAQHLNFRHAAAVLGVSQSSISSRIKALEEDLGILLFERRPRGVRLTEAGKQFIEEIAVGIGHIDHAIKTAGALARGKTGRLRMGLHAPLAHGYVAELRRRYRQEFPGIDLIIMEGRSCEAIRQILDGTLDVALVSGRQNASQIHRRELWTEPLVIALSASHPFSEAESVSWTQLASETFIVRQGGAGAQVYDHVACRIGERRIAPRIQRRDVERDTLMQIIAEGEGITLTCQSAGDLPLSGVRFLPISDEPEPARYSAIWSPHNRNPALTNLLELADEMSRSASGL